MSIQDAKETAMTITEYITQEMANIKEQYDATEDVSDKLASAIEAAYKRQFLAGSYMTLKAILDNLEPEGE
jgi:formyltetrahydrofolate synthetase